MTSASVNTRIRSHNERAVLALLRDEAPLSRAQLSERLGLTRAAMSRIVASLIERGFLVEAGLRTHSGAGRPGRGLHLSTRWVGIGVDARADRTEVVFMEMGGRVLRRDLLDLPERPTPEQFVHAVGRHALEGGRDLDLTGMGIALPGLMSDDRQQVRLSHHLSWADVPLVSMLREHTGLPVALRHGAECAAIANAREPEVGNSSRLLHVQVASGLGLALTRDRNLDETLPVAWGGAGHVLLGDRSRRCICGRFGCVDTLVGFGAFAARGLAAGMHVTPGLDGMMEFAAEVGRRASADERIAAEMVQDLAADLGRILAVFVTLEVPDSVTLGGYPAALGDEFLDLLDAAVAENLVAPSPLVRTRIGRDASMLGAAMLGLSLITHV